MAWPWRFEQESRSRMWNSCSSTRRRSTIRRCRARSSPKRSAGTGRAPRQRRRPFRRRAPAADVVSRAIAAKLAAEGGEHVWLDATDLEDFGRRFPTIRVALAEAGLDAARDWLPIAPAAHYLSGGVLVDLDGATALPGLWAAGEVACTGVHGANRLASNSLLEAWSSALAVSTPSWQAATPPGASGALAGLACHEGSPALPGPADEPGAAPSSADATRPIPVRPLDDCRCAPQDPPEGRAVQIAAEPPGGGRGPRCYEARFRPP